MRFHLRPSFTSSSSAYRRMIIYHTWVSSPPLLLEMQIGWCGSDDHVGPIRLPNLTLKLTFCVRKMKKTFCASVNEWMNEWICALQLHVLHNIANVPSHLVFPRGLPHFIVGDSVVTREPLLWESSEKQKKKKIWQKEFDIS